MSKENIFIDYNFNKSFAFNILIIIAADLTSGGIPQDFNEPDIQTIRDVDSVKPTLKSMQSNKTR